MADLLLNGINLIGDMDIYCQYSFKFDYDDIVLSSAELVSEVKDLDDGLYRMDKDFSLGLNDSMLLDYNSLTHSSSTYNNNVCVFVDKMGMARIGWWNMNYGSTLLTDCLLGLKYRMTQQSLSDEWIQIIDGQWCQLYQNPYLA